MNKQAELDAIFERIAKEHRGLLPKQQDYAIKEIGRIRGEMAELLADYAGSDGIIKRQRLNRLIRDLDEIEKAIRKYGSAALDEIITESSEWTMEKINGAFTTVTGSAAIAVTSFDYINRDVLRYVTKRFGSDGLVLSDRVWDLAGSMRDDIASVIRSSILRGEGINTMVSRIRQVHDNDTWKIRRLARTESTTSYRAATSFNARGSDVVEYVKLHPGVKKSEGCMTLAEENRYGEGRGIFLPSDSEIYNPHPNCTSFITYVLNEDYL